MGDAEWDAEWGGMDGAVRGGGRLGVRRVLDSDFGFGFWIPSTGLTNLCIPIHTQHHSAILITTHPSAQNYAFLLTTIYY